MDKFNPVLMLSICKMSGHCTSNVLSVSAVCALEYIMGVKHSEVLIRRRLECNSEDDDVSSTANPANQPHGDHCHWQWEEFEMRFSLIANGINLTRFDIIMIYQY